MPGRVLGLGFWVLGLGFRRIYRKALCSRAGTIEPLQGLLGAVGGRASMSIGGLGFAV